MNLWCQNVQHVIFLFFIVNDKNSFDHLVVCGLYPHLGAQGNLSTAVYNLCNMCSVLKCESNIKVFTSLMLVWLIPCTLFCVRVCLCVWQFSCEKPLSPIQDWVLRALLCGSGRVFCCHKMAASRANRAPVLPMDSVMPAGKGRAVVEARREWT